MMDRKLIEQWAIEAGLEVFDGRISDGIEISQDLRPELERFSALVAAHEREQCALVCDAGVNNATDWDSSAWDQACQNRAFAIRARTKLSQFIRD